MYPSISPLLKFSLRMGIHSITNLRCIFGGVGKRGPLEAKREIRGATKMSFPQADGIPKAALEGAEGRGEKERNRKTGWE